MRAIRILLQLVFGLLSTAVVICLPDNDFSSSVAMLLVLALIIIVLGPCWPNQENIDRWTEKWNFQLPTDNPKVAIYVANYLGTALCLYRAWHVYTDPTKELWRYEKTAFSIAGINGVIAFWVFLAFACLAHGMATHAKSVPEKTAAANAKQRDR
ncbi:hypothetical protein [Propionivibrio sp.]|uniref:hypothetical protein n=1 Tax=Propionivibrio sp. TaxID=2212460 RepID=UPI0025FA056E|nr:hypothetical protein [Propionivibrio sp.]MBK8744246.1 hypothetical protein [Propionivibrio sp.]MBL0208833.1 hypothetical protein [Propionivibrio sp.]